MKKIAKKMTPPQILTLGFLLIIFMGSLLLTLPWMHHSHTHVPLIDAIFTAVSATTITGLNTLPTATTWTLPGQIIILMMIEVGALGFMTFAVLLITLTGRRLDLRSRMLAQQALNLKSFSDVHSILEYVLRLSTIIQALGAVLLAFDFIPRFGWMKGIYYSIAHSISAFANAGFVFFDAPFGQFKSDSYVLIVTMLLILAGSLGFLVWRDIISKRKRHNFSLHTRLTLTVSAWLIGIGFVGFLISDTLTGTFSLANGWFNQIIDTLFVAITPRTAGFEIVPMNTISNAGFMTFVFLMFIGGTPGSTSGGIKTTTAGILIAQVWASLRGQESVRFRDRQFSKKTVNKALMLAIVAIIFIFLASFFLSITETLPKGRGTEYYVFEVVSAFSTAGLTLGLTPNLSSVGKVIIMTVMFIGRVGLYTVMFSVLNVHAQDTHIEYPEEEVLIG
ncbi:TrkH family potassium uptake protein [Weissella koreensis]|uniref:Trk family potassium uptake protein n=1 Tax=Weissella koreensis TaxID=165096 RepID=A0A7H1MLT1_9LACO|nr:TrkH family potassium uptake protein [Weissella koreensis]AVH75213.1 Trk family potassium uptake protein [Weissella koreensis]QGN20438.1 Trk family potassium uptake protein [Weissella koreensis]QNT64417.1 Trk family potassium uptake protein [Weissella koreensis]